MSRNAKSKLTPKELLFVANWAGNDTDAARKARYKHPKVQGARVAARPHVADAIRQKQDAMVQESGKQLGRAITITRNDIINRLDKLSQDAESDSAKITALGHLKDIFGLSAKDGKGDLFAGWGDEELDYYRRTGELPARYRSSLGTSESDRSSSAAPARKTIPTS